MVVRFLDAITAAWPELLGAAAGLGGLVAAGQAAHRLGVSGEITRTAVHVGTGAFVVALPAFFSHPAPVTALAVLFVVLNGGARAAGYLDSLHAARPESIGTVTFPLALAVTAPFFWAPERQGLLQTAFLVLAVADPLGVAAGRRAPASRLLPSSSGSWDGILAVAAGSAVAGAIGTVLFVGPAGLEGRSPWAVGLVLGVLIPAVELLGTRGWDNLFIVLAASTALLVLGPARGSLASLLLAGTAGAGFALGAHRAGWLDMRGAVAGALFAASLLAIGGAVWTAPALVFFVGSSLLSRGPSSRRTASQVYANGGWAWAMLVGHLWVSHPAWLVGFLGALAAATADTWSAEIGPRFQERPLHVWTGQRVSKGTSGAVSWAGTTAGLIGALAVGLGYLAAAPLGGPFGSARATLAVCGVAGVLGSAADTLLGASVEALYRHRIGGVEVERRPSGVHGGTSGPNGGSDPLLETSDPWRLVRGDPRVENDRVNAVATAVGALVAATWHLIG